MADLFGIGSAVGSIGSSLIGGAYSARNTDKTNEINKQVSYDNLQFQRENLDYQKALQQQIFDREDTSYQRTVSDMRASGMSPLAMQGTNGAGEVISTTAPQNGFVAQRNDYDMGSALNNSISTILQGAETSARLQELKEQVRGQKLDNSLKALTFFDNVSRSGIDLNKAQIELSRSRSEHQYEKTFGFNRSMNPLERTINGLFNVLGQPLHSVYGDGDSSFNSYRSPSSKDFTDFMEKARNNLNLFSPSDAISSASSVVEALQDKVVDKVDKSLGIEHVPGSDGKKSRWNFKFSEDTQKKLADSMRNSFFNQIFGLW